MKSIAFVLLISSISAVFAQPSAKWTVLGKEYAVDTLKHCQVGPGTTLTILDLTGADRQRVFFTTTDLANPIVQIKTICGNNNLKTNLTIPQMIENNDDKANEYFAGVNADLFSANGPIGTTVVNSEIFKTARSTTDWYSVGADTGKPAFRTVLHNVQTDFDHNRTNVGKKCKHSARVKRFCHIHRQIWCFDRH